MLLQAAGDLSLDLRSSWLVGDAWSDLLAGQAAGLEGTILVKTGRGSRQLLGAQPAEIQPFLIANDLFSAYSSITDILLKRQLTDPNP